MRCVSKLILAKGDSEITAPSAVPLSGMISKNSDLAAEWWTRQDYLSSRRNKDLALKTRQKLLIETPSEFSECENAGVRS